MSDSTLTDAAPPDVDLIRLAARGERDAFAVLVGRHAASIHRLALAMTHRQDLAEDILQQTFLAAWRTVRTFRGDASVRTWLLTIARHAASRARTRHEAARIDGTPLEELGLRAGWGDPERHAIRAERRHRLAAAFGRLAADDREILTLRELEGLSGEETAAVLGVGLPAMKSRLHRARLRLAAEWRKEAGHAAP
ncbi:MAG: sigma-70 family RNA polymerase sigma factor [Vicinamibacterales bacterium]